MVFGCKHNFQYSQGRFQCSKCHKIASERQFKRSHNKRYVGMGILGILIISGIYAYANYDITFNDKDSNAMLPLTMIQRTIDDMGNNAIVESIQNTANEISESVPITIEPKSETLANQLRDCSVYKKDVKDVADAYVGIVKTKDCELYNVNVVKQASSQGTVLTPPVIGVYLQDKKNISNFSIEHIGVIEKDKYNVIIVDIHIEPSVTVNKSEAWSTSVKTQYYPSNMGLKNENGKIYLLSPASCQAPLGIYEYLQNPGSTVSHCYKVEKNFNKFDVLYGGILSSYSNEKQNLIGTFVLN